MPLYHEYYPWETFVTEQVMGHSDGSVSLMFSWDGVDNLLFDDARHYVEFKKRLDALHSFDDDLMVEHHFYRERDNRVIDDYLAHSQHMVRGQALAMPVRTAMADHFRAHARANSVFVVLSLKHRPTRGLRAFVSSTSKKKQDSWRCGADRLLTYFSDLQHHYAGATCLSVEDYVDKIIQSFDRDRFGSGYGNFLDYRFDLSDV